MLSPGIAGGRWIARPDFSPASLQGCKLHAEARMWREKNCCADAWISMLQAAGLEPHACLGHVLSTDFEGDQWTFFKPSHDDLYDLYRIEVQELTVWRPLLEHAAEQLNAGRLISTESDGWWLPDTAGIDYRLRHTKTTIVLNEVDLGARRLGYFHNTGYHFLEGEDFDRTFRVGEPPDPAFMPMFAELVKLDRLRQRPASELRAIARARLRTHVERRPASNPFLRFRDRFVNELPHLQELGPDYYHAWAFANTRQAGAALEVAAQHLRWLDAEPQPGFAEAAAAFERVAAQMKSFILKGARLARSGKPADDTDLLVQAADCWQAGMQALANQGGDCHPRPTNQSIERKETACVSAIGASMSN